MAQRQEVPSVVIVALVRCAGLWCCVQEGLGGAQHLTATSKAVGKERCDTVQLHSSCALQWFLLEKLRDLPVELVSAGQQVSSCSRCRRSWAAIAGCFFLRKKKKAQHSAWAELG